MVSTPKTLVCTWPLKLQHASLEFNKPLTLSGVDTNVVIVLGVSRPLLAKLTYMNHSHTYILHFFPLSPPQVSFSTSYIILSIRLSNTLPLLLYTVMCLSLSLSLPLLSTTSLQISGCYHGNATAQLLRSLRWIRTPRLPVPKRLPSGSKI